MRCLGLAVFRIKDILNPFLRQDYSLTFTTLIDCMTIVVFTVISVFDVETSRKGHSALK